MSWPVPQPPADPFPGPFGPPAPAPRPWYRRRGFVLTVAGISLLLVGNLSAQDRTVATDPVSTTSVESAQRLAEVASRDCAAARADRLAAEAAALSAEQSRRQAADDLAKARTLAEQAAADRRAADAARADQAAEIPPSPAAAQGFVGGQPAQPSAAAGSAGPATDPRFPTCRKAKAAGYGHYRQGKDPEYEWYRDADHDGVVCE